MIGDRTWRVVAVLAGLVAVLCAVAMPFLPVVQQQSSVHWPQAGGGSVTAPLVSYAPQSVSARIPCTAFDALADRGGVVVSTLPARAPDLEQFGFVVKVVPAAADRPGRVDVVSRRAVLWSAGLDQVRDRDCAVEVRIDAFGATVRGTGALAGASAATGGDPAERPGEWRPQVVGVFSDLGAPPAGTAASIPAGMAVDIQVDSRFSTSPTPLKLGIGILCVLATILALVALHRLDRLDGRRGRRVLPARWWRVRPPDLLVVATLLVWHVIGANTSDDGYQIAMARASNDSGYMANFFRWFGVTEAPFGTPYYELLAWMTKLSTASPWIRLPALLAALLSWWVISREVIPRLGAAARAGVVMWTAALVFLAFWLPYNNGLRPEPIVAVGVLLTWCSVERAIATGRVLPAAIALVVAATTLTAGPSGLICCAALIAGARRIVEIVLRRARTVGWPALVLPLLAAGLVILVAVFGDETLASVRTMTRVHAVIAPNDPWFAEYLRYQFLLQPNGDGWLTRRFGVFVLILGLLVCGATMLRRSGRIPGTAQGPALRLLGVTVGAMALMTFNPTKWNHHFGVLAGLGGAVAALTAVAVGPRVLGPLRNRALFAAALFFALAMCFVAANGYWYVSSWGVPFWDKPPRLVKGLSSYAVGLVAVCLAVAVWAHIRPSRRPPGRFARIPVLTVVAGFMVLLEVASFVKSTVAQYPSYSLAKSNVTEALSGGCGLADDVLVEPDPTGSVLAPLSGDPETALAGDRSTGFTPDGVAGDLTADELESTTGRANSVSDDNSSDTRGGAAGTEGTVALPFGLDPARVPVLGSYQPGEQRPADLTTGWYRLPPPDASGSRSGIVAVAAAGRIRSVDADGVVTPGQDVQIEYGTAQSGDAAQSGGAAQSGDAVRSGGMIRPIDIGPTPSWRNLRVPLADLPASADVVRIVVSDNDLDRKQWVAVTPPRVPRTETLQQLVGRDTPVLLDWAVGLNFPCQRLLPNRVGVATPPEFRIMPDRNGATITTMWQGHDGGGPLGWTDQLLAARTIPSYLDRDWDRDWGQLEQYHPLDQDARPATVDIRDVTRTGWWSPGPIPTAY